MVRYQLIPFKTFSHVLSFLKALKASLLNSCLFARSFTKPTGTLSLKAPEQSGHTLSFGTQPLQSR